MPAMVARPSLEEIERLCRTIPAPERLGATIRPALDDEPPASDDLSAIEWSEPRVGEDEGEEAAVVPVGVLGEGGMGRVLLARQRSPAREVAVKVLKSRSSSSRLAAALRHEGAMLGRVEHPNVVPIHALARDEHGGPALILKRVDGVPWSELIADPEHAFWAEVRTISEDRRAAHLEIFMQVAQAVEHAHEKGILHRDVKAENVIVGRWGEVYLADWGLAVVKDELAAADTPAGIVGTPTHFAPEMARGANVEIDERTDVYLLGATLHEVLTGGRGRHEGQNLVQLMISAMTSEPHEHAADVPDEIADIANRATAAEPEARYPSVRELRDAIASHLRHAGSLALVAATEARHAKLLERVEHPEAGDEVYRLLAACRFGYGQALSEWAENEEASRRLSECLVAVARFELDRGRADAAGALISELEDAPAELADELASLTERSRQRREELEALERETDLSASARVYAWLFGGLGIVIAVIALAGGVIRAQGAEPSAAALVAMSAFALTALVVGTFAARRHLLDRRASRGVVGILIGAASGVLVERLIGLHSGVDTSHILTSNSVMAASACVAATFFLQRWFAWLAGAFLIAAVVGAAWPSASGPAFLTAAMLTGVVGGWRWYRGRKGEPPRA